MQVVFTVRSYPQNLWMTLSDTLQRQTIGTVFYKWENKLNISPLSSVIKRLFLMCGYHYPNNQLNT